MVNCGDSEGECCASGSINAYQSSLNTSKDSCSDDFSSEQHQHFSTVGKKEHNSFASLFSLSQADETTSDSQEARSNDDKEDDLDVSLSSIGLDFVV